MQIVDTNGKNNSTILILIKRKIFIFIMHIKFIIFYLLKSKIFKIFTKYSKSNINF